MSLSNSDGCPPMNSSIYMFMSRFPLQLDIIIQQPYLFTRLERRQSNVWAAITTERVSQSAIPAAPDLSLYREIYFSQIVGTELERIQRCVGIGAFCGVFGVDFLFETACAIFAGATSFSGFRSALGCYER